MINGEITRTDDDALTGWIASLSFDTQITLSETPYKAKDSVRSDTARRSCWFSFSNSFRRASCDRCIPP